MAKKKIQKENKGLKLVRYNTLVDDFVLIDGAGRCGKSIIGFVLASMKRVEKYRIDPLLDYVARYYSLGKMSHDAAITALKIEADEKLYNMYISRYVNFRPSDDSGVFRGGRPWTYIKRLFKTAKEDAVDRMRQDRPIFQDMTHDGLHMASLYFDAFGDKIKIVHVLRNPIDSIYEMDKRGFGERIGTDPRELQLTYELRGEIIPLNAEGWGEDYLKMNPTERVVGMTNHFFRRNFKEYDSLDKKRKGQIHFIRFEDFVTDPWPHCLKLAKVLGTELTPKTKKILKREMCPRKLDTTTSERRLKEVEKKMTAKYRPLLKKLLKDYDKRVKEMFDEKKNNSTA